MKIAFAASCLFLNLSLYSQECKLVLYGNVLDKHEESSLAFANVVIEETGNGTVVDTAGFFSISNLCEGDYHLLVSHIGCKPVRQFIRFRADTTVIIELEHHAAFLEQIEIEGKGTQPVTQTQEVISMEELDRSTGKSLAEIVKRVPGVTTIKGGSGIFKPVIHGLYGNRISVVNNGVKQAGQQWGNDHAPEIDPFSAKQIAVVKGVDAIEYGGNSLGGVVLLEPGNIKSDPHLHGAAHYLYNTNGKGHTGTGQFEQGGKFLHWRVTGTMKQIGDRKSPAYYLTNTGNKEANFSLQLAKNIHEKWFNRLYYSYYQAEIGLLRGAHIGNLTDLEEAIDRDAPFFTQDQFSYQINAPRQAVQHHLLKASTKYFVSDQHSISIVYALQNNQRKEFDVRRGGRSDIPALHLDLQNHFAELNMTGSMSNRLEYKVGGQYKHTENSNDPGTGILPLIPDYLKHNAALYGRFKFRKARMTYEVGGRYDYIKLDVTNISKTIPRVFEFNFHEFHNYSLASGLKIEHREQLVSKFNIGLTQRSPEANEMYSSGLHQGVAGIEEGNTALNPEIAAKIIWTTTYSPSDLLLLKGTVYYQHIDDYIFLEPQEEFRLTIRGAFPVFLYRQTNATISGLDLSIQLNPIDRIDWDWKYALVRGQDVSNDLPLVYMPTDQLSSSVSYTLPIQKGPKELKVGLDGQYVFKQNNLEASQDFLTPPAAYFLVGSMAETHWKWKKNRVYVFIQIENLLDRKYRDYLNRLRYYSDSEGRNIRIGLKYGF